jgi:hypothetical protein
LGLATDTWYYIEVLMTTHPTTGAYELRVDGVNVLSGSNVDTEFTGTNNHDTIRFGGSADGYKYDDIYVLNTSGSVNNTFLGDREVVGLLPNAVGDSADWTNSAASGDNFEYVDEAGSDGDSTYNESNTTNHVDLYNFENLTGSSDINGIQVNAIRRVTTGSNTFYQPCKSGATTSDGTSESVSSTTYGTGRRVMESDPDTSTAWTTSGLGSAQFGIKVG